VLLSLRSLDAGEERHGEVCIIGSGPAGTTLAVELARQGRQVLLLEGGGEAVTDESQAIYRGSVVGDTYFPLESVRLRCLGGSSNHWGGWCRPLDEDDFGDRPDFPLAVWPIGKEDLDPYLDRSEEILELPSLPADRLVDGEHGIRQIHFHTAGAVRFWSKFGPALRAAPNVRVVNEANVTLLRTDGSRVTGLTVEDFGGVRREIRADRYVLATGGIENSRLLLWSDRVQNGALVPAGSPLGAYWMEHPHATVGHGLVPRYYATDQGFHDRQFFSLTAAARRELGILGCGLRFVPLRDEETRSLVDDLACAAPGRAIRAARESLENRSCGARLRAAWEQEPIAENRVALSETERDRFGIPRTVLHWRRTDTDIRTVRDSAIRFGRFLAERDFGRLRLEPWVLELEPPEGGELAGKHHMGGTRMAESPARGVVDANCKVFGQENLFVAGSSVFPAAGHANPTQTIVQLALRLADHLTRRS